MIAVVDYGMGNLASVRKALQVIGAQVRVTSRPTVLQRARGVVVPGVGAFGMAMQRLTRFGLVRILKRWIIQDRPFFGICLGLQILFDTSEEALGVPGLGMFPGRVVRFPHHRRLKVPHMGWNTIQRLHQSEGLTSRSVLNGVRDRSYVYFVHSYYPEPRQPGVAATLTRYGVSFPSAICRGRLFASQFHPEKSGATGLRILRNFVRMAEASCG